MSACEDPGERGAQILDRYAESTEASIDDRQTLLGDALADLMAVAGREGLNFREAVGVAQRSHQHETTLTAPSEAIL